MSERQLEGKCALVLGAPRSIGSAVAVGLAIGGADVAVGYCASSAEAEPLVCEIEQHGGRGAAFQSDQAEAGSAGALAGYTRGAALDRAPRKVTANIIEPGMIDTEMTRNVPEDIHADIMGGIPLKQFRGLDEMEALAGFLAGMSAPCITGATMRIDGGFFA